MVQGHRNPFSKPLTDYTAPELDFICEMASIDEPDRWQFVRKGAPGPDMTVQSLAQWKDVLGGVLEINYMVHLGVSRGMANAAAWRRRRAAEATQPRFGLSRGGKPLDEAPGAVAAAS